MLLGSGCTISGHGRFGLLEPGISVWNTTRLYLFLFAYQITSTLASIPLPASAISYTSCTACTVCSACSSETSLFQSQADPAHFEIAHRCCASRRRAPEPNSTGRSTDTCSVEEHSTQKPALSFSRKSAAFVVSLTGLAGRCDENCQPDCCTGKRRVPFPSRVRLAALSSRLASV